MSLRKSPLADRSLSMPERIAWGVKHIGLPSAEVARLIAVMEGREYDDVQTKPPKG